jgi:hypothetical protein
MLFRVFNIKWRTNVETYTPESLYVRVYDSTYEAAETTAMQYMAKFVPNATEWSMDNEWWDHEEDPEKSLAYLLGASREVLSQCVEEMQNLLMEIPQERIGTVSSKMTKFQIESAAKLVRTLEASTEYSFWAKRTPSNVNV